MCLAKKADGTWRFCTDYRRLNDITKEAKYPLPRIEDCLDHLGKASIFSKLDLRSGYWQVRIHPSDVEKTAFRTQYGHHEWLVMPFGLQGAPSCFQRMMNHYLRKYLGKFVLVYLDDILIYSNSPEEHLEHLRLVLDVLRAKKLYAKSSKCDLWRPTVAFLGFIVKQGHVDRDPGKVQAVVDWPAPKSVREVRSFLGLCNFYRKFIEHYATLAKPLTDILKSTQFEEKFGTKFTKTAPVTLGEKELQAFENLKKAMTSAPCLVVFDPTKPTEVWADASGGHATIGAVLMQDHGKGWQPVAFTSKVMNSAESHYPTFEQELLALKKALEEWRHYLLPITFTARTDHNGLKYLKTQKTLSERQWHWLAFFSEYDFTLNYRPGKNMVVPDSLSRRPHTTADIAELLRVKESYDDRATFEVPLPDKDGKPQKVLLRLFAKKTPAVREIPSVFDYEDDPDYGKIYRSLSTGGSDQPSETLYSIEAHNLVWKDRQLLDRICVPRKYRALLLQECHDNVLRGHFGIDKTYHVLRKRYIWPHMKHHVEQYVRSCDQCQKNKARHQKLYGTPVLPEIPLQPWESVTVDFCGPLPKTSKGSTCVMGVICNLIRACILIPCTVEVTAKGTAELYVRHVLSKKGTPRVVHSDRGPQFVANFWKCLWKALGSTARLAAAYHPQSQALIERQNKTFIEALRSFINARQDDWDEILPLYEFAYNISVNPSMGSSPFQLEYGREPTTPLELVHSTPSPAAQDFVLHLQNGISAARDHIRQHQATNADRLSQEFQPIDLEAGDAVLLSTEHYNLQLPSEKLAPKWIGPLKVLEKRGPNSVRIEVPPRLSRIQPVQNVANLKRYMPRDPEVGPPPAQSEPVSIEGHDEFEVEEILAHRGTGKNLQYLTRFVNCGPEDDLWLPAQNLKNAPEMVEAYWVRQRGSARGTNPRHRQYARRHLVRLGHEFVAEPSSSWRGRL